MPVSTVAGGILFLDERLTVTLLIGGLIAIAGVVIINFDRRPAANKPPGVG